MIRVHTGGHILRGVSAIRCRVWEMCYERWARHKLYIAVRVCLHIAYSQARQGYTNLR